MILSLKEKEEGEQDYTQAWTIRGIVKQHSDFVSYPVMMEMETPEPIPEEEQVKDKDGNPVGEVTRMVKKLETLNSHEGNLGQEQERGNR